MILATPLWPNPFNPLPRRRRRNLPFLAALQKCHTQSACILAFVNFSMRCACAAAEWKKKGTFKPLGCSLYPLFVGHFALVFRPLSKMLFA